MKMKMGNENEKKFPIKKINGVNNLSFEEFVNITSVLEKNYDRKYDSKILKIWYHELKKYSKNQYKKVVIELIKHNKFLPTLSEVLEIEVLPDWLDKKIEKRNATKEEIMEMEELLKEYR